jgi:crotonobetaine/carnitine-CoA ligase
VSDLERAIGQHPAVANVAVYAVPSELAEDEVMSAPARPPNWPLSAGVWSD